MSVLALIPARGGSKSIPRKNVRLLAGHPLVAYSIAAGLQAHRVDRVVVSTDDTEIAEAARQYGAETPFLRPAELAGDEVLDFPVFLHALEWLEDHERFRPEVIVQLRPTSPLRPPGLVDAGIELLLGRPEADSVRCVTPSAQNPYKMWRIEPSGFLSPLLPGEGRELYNMPRQVLPPTYWQTGHLDVLPARTLREKRSLTGTMVLPLLLDAAYSVDIDQPRDHERAEQLIRAGELAMVLPARKEPGR